MGNLQPKFFIRTYSSAQHIRDLIIHSIYDDEIIEWYQLNEDFYLTETIQEMFSRPQKHSYLHEFINFILISDFEYESRKYPDDIEWNVLTSYMLDFKIDNDLFNGNSEEAFLYKEEIADRIHNEVYPIITEEVFSILFYDKEFLFHFNLFIAQRLNNIVNKAEYNIFNSKGNIKRASYWPQWLKKGIFYRERGRCSYCFKDVSGLLNTENKLNIDHVIPLASGGTNDTCNLQLLCEECNQSKKHNIKEQEQYHYFKIF